MQRASGVQCVIKGRLRKRLLVLRASAVKAVWCVKAFRFDVKVLWCKWCLVETASDDWCITFLRKRLAV